MNVIHPGRSAVFLVVACAWLASCSKGDETAERIEAEISREQVADPADRRAAAEALAEDARSLGADAETVAEAQAEATRQFEQQRGTVEQVMAKECAELRLQLSALQQSADILTTEETAQRQDSIKETQARIAQNCQ